MSADADGSLFPSIPYFYIPVSFFLASFLLNFPPNQVYWYHKEKQQRKGTHLWLSTKQKLSGLKPAKAANIISAQIIMKPDCVLGLATGSSPIGTYKQLIEWYNKGDLDFAKVTTINLDEYKGLDPDNDQSYRYFMNTNLFDHVNIDKARTFVPDA